jgi:peroxiredoxin (alkyl hydroperoxide reductase subunit C)
VFFIDPKGILRAMMYYPRSLGRNTDEIKRVIQALQKSDAERCSTPADWRPGKDVIVPGASSDVTRRTRAAVGELYSPRWYLTFRRE